MDAGLDEDQTELAVLVLAVTLEMLADGDGLRSMSANTIQKTDVECLDVAYLLDQHVKVLWDLWCEAYVEKSLCQSMTDAEA